MNDAAGAEAPPEPRICDYEGSPYRTVFWEQADRGYEDAAERLALRAMLPPTGERLVEIGAGFGRLVDAYAGYRQVILLDYAHSMLEDARARLGDAFTYVCADLYRLPFATHALDTVVQVRVLHHVEDVPAAFGEVARVLRGGGVYVLEFANKRNLKSIARYYAWGLADSPFAREPREVVALNWNFHPDYVESALRDAGLAVLRRRAVSHFRVGALKRLVPAGALARVDGLIGDRLGGMAVAPSQFLQVLRTTGGPRSTGLWRCPRCGAEPLAAEGDGVPCTGCGARWPIVNGIHVFRENLDLP